MERNNDSNPCSIEQELACRAGELEARRGVRAELLADFTLKAIGKGVMSKEAEIDGLMTATKGNCANSLRELVVNEIMRSAEGRLWCPSYEMKLKGSQRMMVFTGRHWETVEPQQWMDFVDACAESCGIPESMIMSHAFMNMLYENVAFNLKEYRRQTLPEGELWLNVSNGTLVLHKDGTIQLREQRKEDLFTYVLPYPYDAQATCPLWHSHLDKVLPEAEAQQVLGEFTGYCMTTGHALEKILLLYGEGQNGKSVTLEVIEALLGSTNVSYLSLSDLTCDDVKRAGIEGKLLNISHESGKEVNANVLKQLTSGERVLIKHLYRDPYETRDYGKFMAAFNVLPRAENTFGFFRRLIILPFEVTIDKEEIDRHLTTKLKRELPGILNWTLAALSGLMARGEFTPSKSCERALERYRLQSDSVRLFLTEMCETSTFTSTASELFTAYRNYCNASSLKSLGKMKFIARLEALGHVPELYGKSKLFHLKTTEQ